MKNLIKLICILLPWSLRRIILIKCFQYEIAPTAYIGRSWVFPKQLRMSNNATIGNLTVVKGLDLLEMAENSSIGNGNWISGFPSESKSHFSHMQDRAPQLVLKRESAITSQHMIDCTDRISIGEFTIFAGFRSQILTHSIDFAECRQSASSVNIGDYVFVGTGCTVLPGTNIPSYSIVQASSLVKGNLPKSHALYGGQPAKEIKDLSADLAYFMRKSGFVN